MGPTFTAISIVKQYHELNPLHLRSQLLCAAWAKFSMD